MQVDLLASGSKGNSCLIRTEKACFLIDCGTNRKYLKGALEKCGVKMEDVQAIFVTHAHSDHISALKFFSHVPVYSWCELKKVENHRLIGPDMRIVFQDVVIETISLSHDTPHTLGFIVEQEQEKLVYVTDTGYVKNRCLDKLANADHYIVESNHDPDLLYATSRPMVLKQRILGPNGHLSNADCAALLARLAGERTRTITLAHLSDEANTPQLALQVLKETFQAHGRSLESIQLQAAVQFEPIHIT